MKTFSEEHNQIFLAAFMRKLQIKQRLFEFWHTPNGGGRSKSEAGKLKLMGVHAGVPDIIIMTDKIIFIEIKKSNGKKSDQQDSFIKAAENHGHACYVIYADTPNELIEKAKPIMAAIGYDQTVINEASKSALSSIATASEKS